MNDRNSFDIFLKELFKSIKYFIDKALKKTTKVYDGLVISNNNNGRWNVKYNGEIHAIKAYGSVAPIVNSIVKVIVPQGNQSLAWFFVPIDLEQGSTGPYFTPSVSDEGIISWTNNGGLPNPTPVDISGPQGETGPQGERGETGPQGPQGIQGEQGPKGDTGPRGPQGVKGETGPYYTPSVSSDGDLSWTNNGDLQNPTTVNIKGPQGSRGPQGPQGETGPQGERGETGPQGPQGPAGKDGLTTSVNGVEQVNGNIELTLNDFGVTASVTELNILDGVKATTKELNYLDGVTSNIQNQINNTWNLSRGTSIPQSSDLNNYTTIGNYYCASTAIAQTLLNTPTFFSTMPAFILKVFNTVTSSIVGQIIITHSSNINTSNRYFIRELLTSGDWNNWAQIGPTDLITLGITATADELNILDGVTATTTEINYLDGVTSNIQTQIDSKQDEISGGASTIVSDNLTTSRALVSNANGKVAVSNVTSTELGYLDGVTSAIQTQLNGKQSTISGAATSIVSNNLTANRALVSNSSGKVAVSNVTNTELGYLDGTTSNIQTQINQKVTRSNTFSESGGSTYGISYDNSDGSNFGSIGGYGNDGNGSWIYIGWGDSPWRTANNLAVSSSQLTYKGNNIYYEGNPPSLTELGINATTEEINYLDGVTSNIQTQIDGKQDEISGGASTIVSNNLTTNRALVSNANGKVAVSNVTSTELGYLDGVTSAIQTQLNGKQSTISGAATSIVSNNLTANRALVSNSSGKVAVSTVTETELGYLDGVTSSIQDQLDLKATRKRVFPTTTGTRAFSYLLAQNADESNYGGIGVLSKNGQGQYYYIGWGADAWDAATGLAIGADRFTYQGNAIYHKGNPPSLTDLGLTATAAELNKLDGVTATTRELNYVDGVTSNIQTQLNSKANENIVNATLLSGSSNWTSSTGNYYQDITVSGMTSSIIVNVIGNFTTSSGLQEVYNTLTRVQSISGAVRIWSNEPTSTDLPIIFHYFN